MRRWIRIALGLYLAVVAYGVFGPEPGDEVRRAGARLRELESQVLDRGASTSMTVATPGATAPASAPTEPSSIMGDLSAEEFFNIVMFVPLGVLVPLAWPGGRWVTVPLGMALSSGIELVQWQFLPLRTPSSSDIQMNSIGVVIGFGLWVAAGGAIAGAARVRRSLP